ncbi:MAG: hypothetical protein BJBARM4_0369 [Candidatus Parvarchaeum acidiphilum ARMAN-4]|jgi:hypothetical protein|uniref:Uncharacterized protein n=1 Tax=Candidatus Parvarchaeum acidiphilum ARMAN-4 TaxID=662760 RepID=D2EF58_PARA4|nr:MAG: hypothetical protein BJBARM4_0369 [Candidatus Parvarchaeum acidiphilum ARMAN-4]
MNMAEKLESLVNPRNVNKTTERDIEVEGLKELYGKPIDFLGVSPFLMDYGRFPKKTYLVLPHFKEKFKLQEIEYSNDTVIIKVKGNEKEKIEPMDYMHDNGNGSYSFPRFISIKTSNGYLQLCSSRFENSDYVEIKKNTKKIKVVLEK